MLQKLNELPVWAKFLVMLVLAAGIPAGAYYGYINGEIASNKVKAADLEKKKAKNKELRDFETRLNDLDRQIVTLKQQMEIQKKIVPDDKDVDKFITLLQETATNAGIGLRKLEAKPVSTREYYSEVPFAIEIDGPYYGIVNFFDKLSKQERIVNVEGLKMTGVTNGGRFQSDPSTSVSVTCTAKTFFSRDTGPAPR